VYRYSFDQTPLAAPDAKAGGIPMKEFGARHAGEIEYVFGTFPLTGIAWQDEDRNVSDLILSYWSNFARTANPNAPGLPDWPKYTKDDSYKVMHLSGNRSHSSPDVHRQRYEFLDENPEWWKAGE
jgi:para-nitrobenzyl esterase